MWPTRAWSPRIDGDDRRIAAFTSPGHATVHTHELSIPAFLAIRFDVFAVPPALLGTVVAVGHAWSASARP